MKAIRDNIIIKPCPPDEISNGGIIVPDSFKERPSKAWVVSVGGMVKDGYKEGDIVFHVKQAGEHFQVNGEDFYIVKKMDLHGFISK